MVSICGDPVLIGPTGTVRGGVADRVGVVDGVDVGVGVAVGDVDGVVVDAPGWFRF